MKWTIDQLDKQKMPYSFSFVEDYRDELVGFEDILEASPVEVNGIINKYENTYLVKMHIKVNLILESAISLQKIEYPIEIDEEEVFALNQNFDSDSILIENDTLDLTDAIVTDIIVNKPMRSILDGETFESYVEDEEEHVNPAFESLKDFLKNEEE